MSFASPLFLWYFLPAVLLILWSTPHRWRNGVVSLASLVFYAFGGKEFVLALLVVMVVNFVAGLGIDDDRRSVRSRKAILVGTVGFDLSVLAIWKYAGFASLQLASLTERLGGGATPVLTVALPIGISFFTFHHISYVVDVYRHRQHAQRSPLTFITYIAMFPQLVAGPIVRYHEIADQLTTLQRNRLDEFVEGFPRFALGLAKKVVVADTISPLANAVFALPPNQLTTPMAWLGAVAYTLQIYFDFSGYSDMAIGLGRMLGFRLPENFARPYSSVSMTDFWRRWHMSLSRWFRDYLYIPLGGNRGSAAATYRNLFVVFTLTGFWHGAAWTFLVWGLYHGCLLALERATGLARLGDGVAVIPRRIVTLVLVIFGWVLFRAPSISAALHIAKTMVIPTLGAVPVEIQTSLTTVRQLTFAFALLVFVLPRQFVMGRLIEHGTSRAAGGLRVAYAVVAAPYAAVLVAAGTFSPFLYFQF